MQQETAVQELGSETRKGLTAVGGTGLSHPTGAHVIGGKGLLIEDLLIEDPEVVTEASRWATGRRGEPAEPEAISAADMAPFVKTSIAVGARVLASTADSSSVTALSGVVTQLAERAETASQSIVTDAKRAAGEAIELTVTATKQATEETTRIIDNASKTVQVEMARTVKGGVETVERELKRLLGGEKAPVVEAIKDIVGRAMGDAQVAWQATLGATLIQVGNKLDVDNPSSPLSALERRLHDQQNHQHAEITGHLQKVQDMVGAMSNAATTAAAVAVVEASSPAKGLPFDEAVGRVAEAIAAGMAANYTSTRNTVGVVKACKKGDGLLEFTSPEPEAMCARVVLEYTTSAVRRNWSEYLEQAERNRTAQASLGIVPCRDLVPGGELLAVLAPTRIVMAYDPAADDPSLFRSALQLLSVQAQRLLADSRTGDFAAVDAKIGEAKRAMLVMQELIKTATTVRSGASKVVTGLESLHAAILLSLEQAQTSLRNATRAAT